MKIKVLLPISMVPGAMSTLEVEAQTVEEVFVKVINTYPDLEHSLLNIDKKIPGYLAIFLNGVKINHSELKEIILNDNDNLSIIPPLAGGEINTLDRGLSYERYTKQILLNNFGITGQKKIENSKVLIIGAGGLGNPILLYLSISGVGQIGIVDGDKIEITNLARQFLYSEEDLGLSKSEVAVNRMKKINPNIEYQSYDYMIEHENGEEIIKKYDLVIDATDNFKTRYLVNELCVTNEKPLIDVAAVEYYGQIAIFLPNQGCYKCLFPEYNLNQNNCSTVGILGAVCGYMGAKAAIEAIKILLNIPIEKNVYEIFNAVTSTHQSFKWEKDKSCPVCGAKNKSVIIEKILGNAPSALQDNNLTVTDFKKIITLEDYIIIDCREQIDRVLKNSIPYNMLLKMRDKLINRLENINVIICICEVGIKSSRIAEDLRNQGINNVFNLSGGINSIPMEWREVL